MAINTTLYQTSPYYDDYVSSGNEAKGHLKILFKPGISTQVRELNQLQTLLQTQIDRFGSSVFENGSRVLDGDVTVAPLYYIDITFSNSDLVVNGSSVTAADVLTRVGQIKNIDAIIDANASPEVVGLTSEVVDYEALIATDTETRYRLYVKYTKKTEKRTEFFNRQSIRSQTAISGDGYSINTREVIGEVKEHGYASRLHIDKGVYFIGGYFVNIEETDVIIKRPDESTRITGKVAFKVTETITTAVDDSSLLDNATGVPNTSAPGADRYAITLSLVALTDQASILNEPQNAGKVFGLTSNASSSDFISLLTLQNGRKVEPLSTKYSTKRGTLGDTLARRTSEESGNYSLNKITVTTREAYNDGINNGAFESTETSVINDLKSKYVVDVNPCVLYVGGNRTEIRNRFSILQDKSRGQKSGESITFKSGETTYIEGTFTAATLPDIENNNIPASSYQVQGASGRTITPTGLEKVRGTGLPADTVYRLYFTLGSASYADINSATNIIDSTVTPQVQFNPIEATFKVRGNKNSTKLVKLPRKVVSGVRSNSTTFVKRKEFSGTSGSAGDYYVDVTSLGSNTIVLKGLTVGETFRSTNEDDYIISNGSTFATVSNVSLNSESTEATLTVNVTTGTITAIAKVNTTLTRANKTLVTGYQVTDAPSPIGITTGEVIDLGVKDVVEITSIVGGDSDTPAKTIILDDFVLDNGQRDGSYENAKLTYIGSATLNGNITITLNYLSHGSGDYFSRDSYPIGLDYEKIPSYKGCRLTDAFDFRGSSSATIDPNTSIDTVVDYYLPRYDRLVVSPRGEFLIERGVSSERPRLSPPSKGSMVLYNLFVPAYTFDARNIKTEYVAHRRYTMADIGKLEKRISNLEYYTSLSLLERNANDKDIFDSSGQRFKNGIFVDSFTGHGRSDVTDPKHQCSIDKFAGHLRPSFTINQVEQRINGLTTDKYVRLPSTGTETIIDQKYASVDESVVPYHVSNYRGSLELSPTGDDWIEVRVRPDLTENENGVNDNFLNGSDSSTTFGSNWTTTSVELNATGEGFTDEQIRSLYDFIVWQLRNTGSSNDYVAAQVFHEDLIRAWSDDTIRTKLESEEYLQWKGTQSGDTRPPPAEITIVPFVRSRRVYFKVTAMKPNTRLYTYLDEVNITGYTTSLSSGSFSDYLFPDRLEANRLDFFNKNATEAFTIIGDSRESVVTDDNGMAEGYFIIPNNSTVRFPIGSRIVTFTDTNSGVFDNNITTRARAYYNASATVEFQDPENSETLTVTPAVITDVGPSAPVYFPPTNQTEFNNDTNQTETNNGTPLTSWQSQVPFNTVTPDPIEEYELTVDGGNTTYKDIEEGGSFTVTLKTKNVADGNIPYTISGVGVTVSDFSGESSLTGNLPLVDGLATKTFSVRIDSETDEQELITLSLDVAPEDHYVQIRVDDQIFETDEGELRSVTAEDNINNEFNREDPLAQSFHLADAKIPRGAYAKSIDLFFKQKTTANDPVRIEIVEVENGTPTARKVNNSTVVLNPSSVNVSDNASSVTTFTFNNPVFLSAEKEYAFIVRSTSKDYRIWMSELDGIDVLTGERIDRDPYLGVAFRSSNASTWSPIQTRDIKFKLNVHLFTDTNTSGEYNTVKIAQVGPGTHQTRNGFFQSIIKSAFTVTSVQFNPGETVHASTSIKYSLRAGGVDYDLNTGGLHNYLDSAVSVSSAPDLRLSATLETRDKYLTPTIDLNKCSLICIGNIINNDVTNETNAAHGNATARYISKKITLNDPADKINVFIGANQPKNSRIRVYARFDDESSGLDVRDANWNELKSKPIPESDEGLPDSFLNEVEYEYDPSNDFSAFQLKIVMTSTDASKVPVVTDLRAITTI